VTFIQNPQVELPPAITPTVSSDPLANHSNMLPASSRTIRSSAPPAAFRRAWLRIVHVNMLAITAGLGHMCLGDQDSSQIGLFCDRSRDAASFIGRLYGGCFATTRNIHSRWIVPRVTDRSGRPRRFVRVLGAIRIVGSLNDGPSRARMSNPTGC